ncbi:hypothetical protein ACFYUD_23965 [Nocardia tengchongensis]|uniref:hypothetical protein n=1 Tax=Nocardia tengchongensis TaxID=2055889 RepID=UPI0036CF9070
MFELRKRWIEEMSDHLEEPGRVTCTDGYVDFAAIVSEIKMADADDRKQKTILVPSWRSLRQDLADTSTRLGPELCSLVESEIAAALQALASLIQPKTIECRKFSECTRTIPTVMEENRPPVREAVDALASRLDGDDVMVAAWHDLITACRSENTREFPQDRVAFLRDTVFGLQRHRRNDVGYLSPMNTAFRVLMDSPFDVHSAIKKFGDSDPEFDPRDARDGTGVSESDLLKLSERIICQTSVRRDHIVWLRVDRAFIQPISNIDFGPISLYWAPLIAAIIPNHDRVREEFSTVPEELLTNEIAKQQLDRNQSDENSGFEYRPGMVYARIVVADSERHSAGQRAHQMLQNTLSYISTEPGSWQILGGSLVFPNWDPYHSLDWGPKRPMEDRVYAQNDRVGEQLRTLKNDNKIITQDISEKLSPALRLLEDLRNAEGSEAAVMASVRAIEHCNSWTTAGEKDWDGFISAYLMSRAIRLAFLQRANRYTFSALYVTLPDPSPHASPQLELAQIREEAKVRDRKNTYNLEVCIKHVVTLRDVYAKHALWRPLAEISSILKAGPRISEAINHEEQRIRACVARLTRVRNAAIHGGPLSPEACESIRAFAVELAGQALHKVMEAILIGKPISDHMTSQRDSDVDQLKELRKTGQHIKLFDN